MARHNLGQWSMVSNIVLFNIYRTQCTVYLQKADVFHKKRTFVTIVHMYCNWCFGLDYLLIFSPKSSARSSASFPQQPRQIRQTPAILRFDQFVLSNFTQVRLGMTFQNSFSN